jgi:Rps23 Pro-64 3,4-dihydroxylase Tpa1-like proline 4-hydroxylase
MDSIFDYRKFENEINTESYLEATPFPFVFIDNLFDNDKLDLVNSEIESGEYKKDIRNIKGEEVKTRSDFKCIEDIPKNMFDVFSVLNGGRFLECLSKLTSIDGLISDPYYHGGGVNQINKSGTLAIHVDGTTHRKMNLKRRLNVILFMNKDWDDAWGGHHEQWIQKKTDLHYLDEKQEWECVRLIRPAFNRLMIFTTNDHSWHGHTKPLSLPNGVSRKSLITYYYTTDRPASDLIYEEPHRALFVNNSLSIKDQVFKNVPIL